MTEMVERVAKALALSHGHKWDELEDEMPFERDWASKPYPTKGYYRKDARTAFTAMREPTEDEMRNAWDYAGDYDPRYWWHAMIDEALRE